MKEIKFRAWIKRKNELMYLKGFRYSGNEKIKITFTDEDCDDCTYTFLNKDVILEQFTGLHDKNGVKIYEGDKILYTDNFKVNGTTSHTSIVEWVSEIGGFYIKAIGYGYYNLNKSQCEKYDYEVIGNIHESEDE